MSQIPNIRHEWLDKQNPRQVDPKWFLFLQQVATTINGVPAQIDAAGRQAQSPLLDRISAQTGSGFLVVAGGSSVAVRTLQEGDGISITNPQGSAGDPVFSLEDLADSGIGDDGLVVLTRDDKGRIAGMAPATSADLAYVDTMHSLGLANAQEALDKALGALPYFSDTAPDPDVNPYWIDTTDLTPYVWYDDGTSAQWIALDALASLAASAVTYDNTTSGLTATNVQDAIDEIALLGGGGSYTDEQAQDAVGTILVDSSHIDFTYNDATPSITASIVAGSIGATELASTTVTPGSYTNTSLTVDADGRITAASNGSSSGLSSGTSNPGSPTTGQQFFRTDLGLFIYYDGTRWLSANEILIGDTGPSAGLSATGGFGRFAVRSDYGLYLTRWANSSFVNGTNNGSNYWTVQIDWYSTTNVATTISSYNTSADTASNWVNHDQNVNAVLNSGAKQILVACTRVGTAAQLFGGAALYARLIVT